MRLLLLTTAICLLWATTASAQGKAKIIIRKNIDGEETIIEKEFDLEEDQAEMEDFLEGEDMEFHFDMNPSEDMLGLMLDGFYGLETDPSEPRALLGISQSPQSDEGGVTIDQVQAGTTAEAIGLLPGDRIIDMNGADVYDMADLGRLVGETAIGEEIKITVERDGKKKKLKGQMKEAPARRPEHGLNMWGDFPMSPFQFRGGIGGRDMAELDRMMEDMQQRMEEMRERSYGYYSLPPHAESPELEQQRELLFDEYMRPFEDELPGILGERELSSLSIIEIPEEELTGLPRSARELRAQDDLILDRLLLMPEYGNARFHIEFETEDSADLSLTVFNSEGQKVFYERLGSFAGSYSNTLDIGDRPEGTYYLQIEQGGKTFSRKILKD